MNILIIGAGNMGAAFVKRLHTVGHQVYLTAADEHRPRMLAAEFMGVEAVPIEGAARPMDVVIVATPYAAALDALRAVGDLSRAVVIDITNPLTADFAGLVVGHETSAAEEIACAFPTAKVVKAFNTVFASLLATAGPSSPGRRISVFVAGDDAGAKQVATTLAQSMGFEVVDAGPLRNARYLEPMGGLNVYLGYIAGQGTSQAPAWVRAA